MKKAIRYTGPYLFTTGVNAGRKFMVVYYNDGSRGTTLLSRYLYQYENKVILDKDTTVDHIDEDKSNDNEFNLQPLSSEENARKHNALFPEKIYTFNCPICGSISNKKLRNVKGNWKKGKSGPFCGRQCARKYQIAGMVKLENTTGLSPVA